MVSPRCRAWKNFKPLKLISLQIIAANKPALPNFVSVRWPVNGGDKIDNGGHFLWEHHRNLPCFKQAACPIFRLLDIMQSCSS